LSRCSLSRGTADLTLFPTAGDNLSQSLEFTAVGKDQVAVVKGDCPTPAWIDDAMITDLDAITGVIAEILDNASHAFQLCPEADSHSRTRRQLTRLSR
jgi:hypothetical protein